MKNREIKYVMYYESEVWEELQLFWDLENEYDGNQIMEASKRKYF
jgi:hypothetical protein